MSYGIIPQACSTVACYTELMKQSDPQTTRRVWHITEADSVPNILSVGLEPRVGPRSALLGEPQPMIYAFPDGESLTNALSNWLGDAFDDDAVLSVLEIEAPGHALVCDPDVGFEVCIGCAIPAKHIRVLVDDVDQWMGDYPGDPPAEWAPQVVLKARSRL